MRFGFRIVCLWAVLVFGRVSVFCQTQPLALEKVTVLDMTGAPARPGQTILIHDHRIAAMGPAGSVALPEGTLHIDAGGRYLIPGLWDMHVHIFTEPFTEFAMSLLVAHGVTGVRDMNHPMPLERVRAYKKDIASGKVLGPRFVSPGPLLDGPGRPPSALGPRVLAVSTEDEAREAVRSLKRQGADFIKVYNRLTPVLYHAVAEEAAAQDIPFAGHVPHLVTASAAADAGQRSIEHLTGILEGCSSGEEGLLALTRELMAVEKPSPSQIEAFLDARTRIAETFDDRRADTLFQKLAANGTWQCPTLISNRGLYLGDIDPGFEEDSRLKYVPASLKESWFARKPHFLPDPEKRRMIFRKLVSTVARMDRAGIRFLVGTDLGTSHVFAGSGVHDELELLVEAGLPPAKALIAATRGPAELLGLADKLGTVEVGKLADLVLLDGNPLEDIANIRQVFAVFVNGRYLDRAMLDALLANAEAQARTL